MINGEKTRCAGGETLGIVMIKKKGKKITKKWRERRFRA